MKSILSEACDALGFFYGLEPGGHRQINVRMETTYLPGTQDDSWVGYVGGTRIPGLYGLKEHAEKAALAWAEDNPEE